MPSDTTFLGLTATNWILVCATLLGPIVAVLITMWAERRRAKHQHRSNIVQTILNTRMRVNDVQYQMAIMAVAVEFRDDKEVMAAHREYMNHVAIEPPQGGEQAHGTQTGQKLVALLKLLFDRIGTQFSEADIDKMSYHTKGVGMQDELLHAALYGMVRIANALERQEQMLAEQVVSQADANGEATSSSPPKKVLRKRAE